MKKQLLTFAAFLLLTSASQTVSAQSIDEGIAQAKGLVQKIKNLKNAPKEMLKQGIKATGSIANNSNYYAAKTMANRRLPFESNLSGNINFDLFGKIKMPFVFSYNSQQFQYSNPFKHPFDTRIRLQQPFHRYQFRPEYKGFKALLGVNSMTFSPLTVSGHRFEGTGFVLKPAKFPVYGSFMAGLLQRGVAIDTALRTPNNRPAFARRGVGFQVGYKRKQNALEVIGFRAADNISPIVEKLSEIGIYPQQNVVASLKGQTMIKKMVEVKAEYAVSGLTENTRLTLAETGSNNQQERFGGLLNVNESTNYRSAVKVETHLKAKKFALGATYNRIDPEYRTLGAYFFTNDIENITANFSSKFLEDKLNIMANIGRQRDDLAKTKTQQMSQWVGSSSLAYAPSEFTNVNLNYSNFTMFTNLRSGLEYLTTVSQYQFLDTLNFRQINQNIVGTLMHVIGKPDTSQKVRNTLTADVLFQKSANRQFPEQSSNIGNLTLNLTHENQNKSSNIGLGLNLMRNDYLIYQEWLLGPSFNMAKPLLNKKLSFSSVLTYLNTFGSSGSQVFNANATLGASIAKQHKLSLSMLGLYRQLKTITPLQTNFWQFNASLSYSYQFKLFSIAKK